ncbi:MAG: 50S ribosomal protein L18 [Parachlamydia sp.]|jgi:large subunit ribosomal protein L18|nr:50S ribosomal protein L18 [Parachlamydia sp.]
MASQSEKKTTLRTKRAYRVRKKLRGNSEKPRLCVVKSNNHIQAQLIDDESGRTLGGTATFTKENRNTEFNKKNKASARKLGEQIAEIAKSKNIKEVVFDRGPFKYHGVLAELADAARAGGLQF